MKIDELITLEKLYDEAQTLIDSKSLAYELQIIRGFTKEFQWNSFSNEQKLEYRIKELRKKEYYKNLYSEIILLYEESVIKLTQIIISFLNSDEVLQLSWDYKHKPTQSPDFVFYRLKNMLEFELFAINKHMKLQFGGHILFDDIMEPLFNALKGTEYYTRFKLDDISDIFKKVTELHALKPYVEKKEIN